MKKILLLVIDGLGDEKIPQLKNQTPLEAAKTPNLDFLAQNGILGEVLPWRKRGELPTSEDCHLALFGFDPKKENPGRGVLEVLGIGFKLKKGDVCLRGNFATVNEDFKVIDRRAQRIERTEKLILALNKIKLKKGKVIVKKAFGHRVGIIIRGKNFGEKITSNDPKKVGVSVLKIKAKDKKSQKTADVLNEFLEKAHFVLKHHFENQKRILKGKLPANFLLVRGAGKFKKIKSFKEKYNLKAGFIAGGTLYKGIGKYLGMEEIKVKGATGTIKTNLKGKFLAAKKYIKKFDFIFLHVKATDNLAEDGNFFGKKSFLEKIDKNLRKILGLKDTLICVTGDHATSSLKKSHCNLPNPILIYPFKSSKKVLKFSERECKRGDLGKIKQIEVLRKILKLAK